MQRRQRVLLGLAGLVLLFGIGAVIVSARRVPHEPKFHGRVKDLLPSTSKWEANGWKVEFRAVADSPEMKKAVSELLNYDDAVFAVYSRGDARVSVYIAYWRPDRMPHRLVAGHTPDVCWTANGWETVAAASRFQLMGGSGLSLPPCEARQMKLNREVEFVAFWHIADGKPVPYAGRGGPPWHAMFTDMFLRGVDQRPEQFFVRISSNKPLEEWGSIPGFTEFLNLFLTITNS